MVYKNLHARFDAVAQRETLPHQLYPFLKISEFIKVCQNNPQLCCGDKWHSLSLGKLCRSRGVAIPNEGEES